jgi:cysteine synthase
MKSVQDATRPVRDDRIRAELYDATFVATPVDGGAKTAMVAESHADPRGSIPKWIVNIYQKDMPSKTLRRMLDRISKVAVAESPWAREVLAGVGGAAVAGSGGAAVAGAAASGAAAVAEPARADAR